MKKSSLRLFTLFLALTALTACTATPPPAYRGVANRADLVPGEEVTANRTENLYAFARRHNVRMSDVIALNNLKPPFTVRAGEHLTLPARDSEMTPLGIDGAPIPRAAPIDSIERKTLDSTSSAVTAVPLEPLAAPTPTAKPSILPPPTPAPAPVPTTVLSAAPTPLSNPTAESPVEEPSPAAVANIVAPASNQTEPAPASSKSASLIWPLQGPIVSTFGSKTGGAINDGVNIAAPKGSPVVAAGGGMVAYAGDEMKGFGNLVLIRHEGGWVTAYAHLDRMIVAKDSTVASGDMIGTVGTSGGVASPQLHFETRRDGKAVNPQTVIKK